MQIIEGLRCCVGASLLYYMKLSILHLSPTIKKPSISESGRILEQAATKQVILFLSGLY